MKNQKKHVQMSKSVNNVWDLSILAESFSQKTEKQVIIRNIFLNALLIHVDPQNEIPAHYEDYDAIFYIIEGTGSIQIGIEKIQVKPRMMIFSPKMQLRGIFPESPLLILGLQEPH